MAAPVSRVAKNPMFYYCPVCGNPGTPFGALDRFTLVEEKPDGMIVVDCLDCRARSESYHRDLRGKVPRKYAQRNAIMMAADFVLDAAIREYNERASSSDGRASALQAGCREFESPLVHEDSRERPVPHAEAPTMKPDKQPLSTSTAAPKSPTKNRRVASAGAPIPSPSSSAAEQSTCNRKRAGSSPVSGSRTREVQTELFD